MAGNRRSIWPGGWTPGRLLVAGAAAAFWCIAYAYLTLPDVRPLATGNPTTTAFMQLRAREAAREGRPLRHVQQWVPYGRVSRNLRRAVLVAEDDGFFEHEGIDVAQLKKSIELNIEKGRIVRGGSTVTQQLAKNLYLSPSKDPLRKFRELIITRRLEAELTKARIFELYLNVIEWGDGVWGAQAAAQTYFDQSAASLSREQAALLAGAIVNPRLLNPARPTRRLLRRQRIVLARMGSVSPPVASADPPDSGADAPTDTAPVAPAPGEAPSPQPDVPPEPEAAPIEPPTSTARTIEPSPTVSSDARGVSILRVELIGKTAYFSLTR